MRLPVDPPVLPMLAKRVDELPSGEGWIFEPKWDGFRALVFRDGDEVLIQSRDTKPLNRYFPEVVESLRAQLPERCVLDGEIVIADAGGLNFDKLQLRIHPAASRIKLLEGDEDLRGQPFKARRERLERLLGAASPPVHVTPATADRKVAADWFRRFEGAGMDGVIAKAISVSYEPNKRVMLKVKHERDCDCVVAGFRWHKDGEGTDVGSLLLGLYNTEGALQHVGVCASFTKEKRKELVEFLKPYRERAREAHPWGHWADASAAAEQRMPGGQSRWNSGKDLSWEPLRAELVVEVAYEHMQGDRFRHLAHFRRWRTDKRPEDCTYEQLEVVAPQELMEIFAGGR